MIPALALAAVFLAGVAALIIRAKAAAKVTWQVLPRGTRYQVPPGFDVLRLDRALDKAVELLSKVWTRSEVGWVVMQAQVVVMRDAYWVDGYGREIGGDSFGAYLRVGSDMGALVHELSHALELNVSHLVDTLHLGWEARGIWGADRAYRAWLKGQ